MKYTKKLPCKSTGKLNLGQKKVSVVFIQNDDLPSKLIKPSISTIMRS